VPLDDRLGPSPVDAETARRTASDVLSRPEYDEVAPSLLERVAGAVLEGLGRVLEAFAGTGAGSAAGYLVLGLLAVLALWFAVRALRGVRGTGRAGALATEADVGRTPAAWRADAEAHEAAGRWRDGVRCRYRALVAELAARGVVEEVPGRNDGEYRAEVADAAPAAAASFAAATAVFERAWYGAGEVDRRDAEAVQAAAEEAVDAVGSRQAAGAGR
jgi:hypothetical protein